ncbi:MAG: NAD(P)-dependent alcohol dehydrogenase [Nocardioides sp.]|uniref:NAD(P)-dependent alcohol dehydrogenase n=1 Tax=Nocardioides sp. TaxID=35761 RepID=UPI0039E342B1
MASSVAGRGPADPVPEVMRACVLYGVRDVRLEERPVPRPDAGEVLVRVTAVGVCGSDTHYFREGRIGPYVVDEPLVLGHEAAGTVAAVGEGVDPGLVGERVSIEPQRPCRRCAPCKQGRYNLCERIEFFATPPVDGAFCDYVVVPADFAHPVPEAVSEHAAALLEPLSVGIAAVRKADMTPGSRVLVTGAGPVGLICAGVARVFGAVEVVVSDPVAERRTAALEYGATTVLGPGEDAGGGFDAFIDCSGAPAAVRAGIGATAPAGRVVLVGMGADEMALPVPIVQNRELVVTGVFRYANTWPLAIELAATGRIDLDSLVTHVFGLDRVAEALEADRLPGALKAVVAL